MKLYYGVDQYTSSFQPAVCPIVFTGGMAILLRFGCLIFKLDIAIFLAGYDYFF